MNAVVFSNFPENLNVKLRKNLEDRDVEIVHFDELTSSTEMRQPDRVDCVICFFEMLSHNQTAVAKQLAHRWGVPFYGLSRKSAHWAKVLPAPLHKPEIDGEEDHVEEPAPPTESPSSLPSVAPSSASLEKQWDEIRDLFSDEVEDLKAKIGALTEENTSLKRQVEGSKLSEEELYKLASSEEKRLHARISQLEGELEKQKGASLEVLGASLRAVVSAGLMTEREAADRLLGLVLGKKKG